MATYLTLDSRYGVTSFDPSNGYTIITEFSELIDDSDVIPILEIASEQVPPVFILVSDHPITQPEDGVSADTYITQQEFNAALASVVKVTPQTFTDDQELQARENIDVEDPTPPTGSVRYDVAQTLTGPEQAQARDNIGADSGGGGSALAIPGYISVYDSAIGTPAVGDDTADDTAALNAAETYALANKLLGVDLGNGIFKITGPVKFSTAVRGSGGNESTACVIRCHSATANVQIGYSSAGDTAHPRVVSGFLVDANGTGDPVGRLQVYAVKTLVENVNATDLSATGTTVASMPPGNMVYINSAQNCHFTELAASACQGSALVFDNGVGGCKFESCHITTAGTLLQITDLSPGEPNLSGFPFGPADNSFDNCIFETRLSDSVQLISAECGSMHNFTNCQFSVSTNTGVLSSGALVNMTSDIVFAGLTAPFSTHLIFGSGCSWNGGAAGAVAGTNPVNLISLDGAQTLDLNGVHYAQDCSAFVYNKAGAGTARLALSGLVTGGGFGARTAASTALSDAKQSIAIGSGVTGYTLTFGGQTTTSIGPGVAPSTVQTKLQALSSIGSGNVKVTGDVGIYVVHFIGTKAGAAQATITSTPTGGAVTVTSIQTGGVAASLLNYANSTSGQFRIANGFARAYHVTAVTTSALVFNADVSVYSEIEFAYTNNTVSLGTLTLVNPVDGQLFTISHLQSAQGESSYVWPSNVVFNGPTPFSRAANGFVSVTFRYSLSLNIWFEVSRAGNRQIDLPFYAGPSQHTYSPSDAGYNLTGATLHKFRAALAKTLHGDSDTHILFLGDSTLGGYNGSTYVYDTCVPRSMARGLAAKTGVAWQQGIQYAIGDKRTPAVGLADNWAVTGAAAINSIFLESTGVATMTRTALPGETGTAIDIYYSNLSSAGIIWKIDGSAQTALAVTGANTIAKTTVTGLANTAHTIEIDGAASKAFILLGTRVYNPAVKSVYVHNLSIGGSRANGGANDLNWSSTSSSGVFGIGFVIPALLAASTIVPDFVVVSIGGNDISNGTDAPTTLTGMDTMFGTTYVAAGTAGLIVHAHKVSGVADTTYDLLSKGKFDHADSLGKAMFNWDDFVQGLATATADGLIGADSTHPTPALQVMIGQQLATLLTK